MVDTHNRHKFPVRDDEILSLVYRIVEGLKENPDLFPSPPVTGDELQGLADTFFGQREKEETAHATAKNETLKKDEDRTKMIEGTRRFLKYAESWATTEEELEKIGWSGRHPKTPTQTPGPCVNLVVVPTGDDDASADAEWDEVIVKGGKASTFRIEVLMPNETSWRLLEAVHETNDRLYNLPRGQLLKFRVIASNKAGRGKPSNTVSIMV